MEYNKSLSARIRRRNKQGFEGIGNHKDNNNPMMGDYKNPIDNHKFDDRLSINPDTLESKISPSYQMNVINQAKRIGIVGKRAGSKRINKLIKAIGQFDSRWYWHNKARNERLR